MKSYFSINNIPIKTRLIFVMLLPVSVIIFFGGSFINKDLQVVNSLISTREFARLAQDLSNLTFELQKERGLSATTNNVEYESRMEVLGQQKEIVDEHFDHFIKNWEATYTRSDFEKQVDVFYQLKENIAKLKELRGKIVQGKAKNIFNSYSKIISKNLQIIQFLPSFTKDLTLSRIADSYVLLLWALENAAKERGILFEIFLSGKIKQEDIERIASAGAHQKELLDRYKAINSTGQKHIFNTTRYLTINSKINETRRYFTSKHKKLYLLNGIQEHLGFGGMIHSFKNYIIRGDIKYLTAFEASYNSIQSLIEQYRLLPGLSAEEKASLEAIINVNNSYRQNLGIAQTMISQGLPTRKIDQAVKVFDEPALTAIKNLRQINPSLKAYDWWDLASERISIFKLYTDSISYQISHHIDQSLKRAKSALWFNSLTIIFVFLVTSLLGYLLLKRVVVELKNISFQMRDLENLEGEEVPSLNISGTDEIASLAKSFDMLMSSRREAENSLRISELMTRSVIENANDGIIRIDDHGTIQSFNPAAEKLFGYQANEVTGKNADIFMHGQYQDMSLFLKTEGSKVIGFGREMTGVRKNGSRFPMEIGISEMFVDGQHIYIGIFRDISERKKFEEDLKNLSYKDALTEIFNRRAFDEAIEREWGRLKRTNSALSLILIDVDFFKKYNDFYGHQKGDECLKKVATALKSTAKRGADFVARYGGEEFAVILPGIDSNGAARIAEQFRKNIEALGIEHRSKPENQVVTISLGVATVTNTNFSSIKQIVSSADKALYKAKNDGRNCYRSLPVENETEAGIKPD